MEQRKIIKNYPSHKISNTILVVNANEKNKRKTVGSYNWQYITEVV